ncbi:mechanosensitive ion channel family protein [Streptacidiphilus rugosus]|uniref:mechanosensitive ion channel family protein n=1 Tax=Streptacidiphilus rugosus TaxID=405783 RepID=UPI000B082E0E|nr:mechanosensitive ion channel domain-containing protein [Streptacidiphilus rugosus]
MNPVLGSVATPVAAVAAAVVAAWLSVGAVERLARRVIRARPHGHGPGALLGRCRRPLLAVLAPVALLLAGRWFRWAGDADGVVRHTLVVLLIAATAWLVYRIASLGFDLGLARYTVQPRDAARVRRVRTQADLMRRITGALCAVLAIAAILMIFRTVRAVGTSVFASAGLIGLIAGIAAQSTLANLFAGMQLAFGDMMRIGDEVVVAGEWGTVEEITLTYVVVATWDQRRIVMPASAFAGKPFENWSRRDPAITGTALLHVDYRAEITDLRRRLGEVLGSTDLWNGKGQALQVVDSTPTTLVVRALMTADNAADAFDLRCLVREELAAHLRDEQPTALPRVPVGAAEPSVGTQAEPSVGAQAEPSLESSLRGG